MIKFFRRVWKYFTAGANQKFSEKADPKIQLEQAIVEAQDQHRRLKEQAASVIAQQKQVEMRSTRANEELVRVDAITANVQSMTGNLSSLTSLFAATLGSPVIKVAAFSYGVRKAAGKRDSDEMTKRVKAELKGSKRL